MEKNHWWIRNWNPKEEGSDDATIVIRLDPVVDPVK
jgi:hypothetical protein